MDATTNNLLTNEQVWNLYNNIKDDIRVKLLEKNINKHELEKLVDPYSFIGTKVRAILCTLNNAAYEDIVKAVYDKLNLNDLFDNRHKYLN